MCRPERVRMGMDIVLHSGFTLTSDPSRPVFQRQRSKFTKVRGREYITLWELKSQVAVVTHCRTWLVWYSKKQCRNFWKMNGWNSSSKSTESQNLIIVSSLAMFAGFLVKWCPSTSVSASVKECKRSALFPMALTMSDGGRQLPRADRFCAASQRVPGCCHNHSNNYYSCQATPPLLSCKTFLKRRQLLSSLSLSWMPVLWAGVRVLTSPCSAPQTTDSCSKWRLAIGCGQPLPGIFYLTKKLHDKVCWCLCAVAWPCPSIVWPGSTYKVMHSARVHTCVLCIQSFEHTSGVHTFHTLMGVQCAYMYASY